MTIGRTLAEAVVRILPDTSGFAARLREQLDRDLPAAATGSADKFNASFGDAMNDEAPNIGKTSGFNFAKAHHDAAVGRSGGDARDVASSFGNVAEKEMSRVGDDSGNAYGDGVHRSVLSRLTAGIGDVRNLFRKNIGEDAGDEEGRRFADKWGRTANDTLVSSFFNPFKGRFSAEFAVILGLAVAAVAPVAATALIAVFVTAIGLGGIAAALAAQWDNPGIHEAIKRVVNTAETAFKGVTEPFIRPLIDGINRINDALRTVLPQLTGPFKELSGAVKDVSIGIAGFIKALGPGIAAVLRDSVPLLKEFGKDLPGLGHALSSFMKDIAGTHDQVFALHIVFDILDGTIIALGKTFKGLGYALEGERKTWDSISKFFHENSTMAQVFRYYVGQIVLAWDRFKDSVHQFYEEIKPVIPLLEKLGIILGASVLILAVGEVVIVLNLMFLEFRALTIAIQFIVTQVVPALITAFNSVKDALVTAYNWALATWGNISNFFVGIYNSFMGGFALPFYNFFASTLPNALISAWNWVVNVWNATLAFFIGIWGAIWANFMVPLIVTFTQTIPNALVTAWQWAVNVWNATLAFFIGIWGAIWANFMVPLIVTFTQTIPTALVTAWQWVVSIWNATLAFFIGIWAAIWANFMVPLIVTFTQTIPNAAQTVRDWVLLHWNEMYAGLGAIWNGIYGTIFVPIINVVTKDIPNAFHDAVNTIGRYWTDLESVIAGPINWIIDNALNGGILAAYNTIAGIFHVGPQNVHVGRIGAQAGNAGSFSSIPFMADGGYLRGPGTTTSDSILGVDDHGVPTARVSQGEYVINARSTQKFRPWLDAINAGFGPMVRHADGGIIPGYSIGGIVGSIGGWLSDAAGGALHAIEGLGQTAIDIITNPAAKLEGLFGGLLNGTPGPDGPVKDVPIGVAKTGVDDIAEWIKQNWTPHFSQTSADVLAIQAWLKSHVNGLPYTWGAVGPDTFDCSGLVGEVINRVLHMPSYRRLFVTGDGSEGAFLQGHGFKPGKDGDLIVGYSDVHTMGVIGGLPFEAGSTPIHVGSGTSDINSFPRIFSLKISGAGGGAGFGAVASGGLQQFAQSLLPGFGWGPDQFGPLVSLWNQESGWNPNAVNPSSGAYGIPQALGQGHPFNLGDGAAQIQWGLQYIRGRYGSPAGAWAHEQAFNWYDNGGVWPSGTFGGNASGKDEYVTKNESMESLLNKLIDAVERVAPGVGKEIRGGVERTVLTARTRGA
jgi:hypothetical protein